MKKVLPYDSLKQYINQSDFGYYRLFQMPDNNLIGGSHMFGDPNAEGSMSSANLVIDLDSKIDLLGNGYYRIALKKSNKTNATSEVSLFFQVDQSISEAVNQPSTVQPMQGLGSDKIEEMINARVNQLMAAKEAEWQAKREMDELKREIAELKRRKPATRKKSSDMQGLLNLALVGGSAWISEQWPNTKPMVEKALGAIAGMSDEEEEEEEEEETGFTRPD